MRYLVAISLFSVISLLNTSTLAQSTRDDLLRQIQKNRSELQELEDQFLAPSEEDFASYAEFLRQPNTGLIRLLPREVYDDFTVRPGAKKSLTVRGGGAYYSFTKKTHEYGYGSDIELAQNYLSVGFAGLDYGMLLKLDDLPLDKLTSEDPILSSLASYKIPTDEREVRSEQQRFGEGVMVNGALYKSRLPLELNTTYALRSINYSETDALVAMRTVRKDTDGSVIIAWKLLQEFPKPELTRRKLAVASPR